MTGLLRAEWHLAYNGMCIPCNWSQAAFVHILSQYSPLRYSVADARNMVVKKSIEEGYEWLIFIDHDVIMPHDFLIKMNKYMLDKTAPIIGGLYFTKSSPAEPLIYRGRGNSYFTDWKLGQKVWVDGYGLGCHLIDVKLLKAVWDDSEEYVIPGGEVARRVFESPSKVDVNPKDGTLFMGRGTEDLPFYTRLLEGDYFKKAGWGEFQKKKFPLLCDTTIFCQHIDNNGRRFPACGEEKEFQ